jgi:hypothetical protein
MVLLFSTAVIYEMITCDILCFCIYRGILKSLLKTNSTVYFRIISSIAPLPDYEPSIAPGAFAAGWREKFRSQPRQVSSIYSLPVNDCPFEYGDQPLNNNTDNVTGNEVDRQRTESDN